MHLHFNELSAKQIATEKDRGKFVFQSFIEVYSKAITSHYGFSRSIFTSHDLNDIEICTGYHSAQWRNDKTVDMDIQRRYKRMCDLQTICKSHDDDIEVSFQSSVCLPMLIAYQNDSFLISLNSNTIWENNYLDCELYDLGSDSTTPIKLRNICGFENLQFFEKEILQKKRADSLYAINKNNFHEKCGELFPSLMFANDAISQLQKNVESQHFEIILQRLYMLEDYFKTWDGKEFDFNYFPPKTVSYESKETLKRFSKQHTFTFQGQEYTVSLHMRYTGNIPGRIYFVANSQTKKGIIFSLTTKLPTVTNPKERT